MKKKLFNLKKIALFCATAFLSLSTMAQMQVGNSDFENWDNVGDSEEEPTNWNSFMTADCTLGSFMCGIAQSQLIERSTDAHSGSYSARIWSKSTFGIVANGNMTLGRVHMGSSTADDSDNYNYTDIADPDFNQPFTGNPDSLVAWVKFNPQSATDKARVSATIHNDNNYRDPDDGSATNFVVAKAVHNYNSTDDEWQRISVPFDYIGPSTDAQYILITFTTSNTPGGGSANDEVFIDDLEMIYNQNELDVTPIADQYLVENEAGTDLTANETPKPGSSVTSRQWKYATTSGGPYGNDITGETSSTYTPEFASAGTYYVVCETDFEGDVLTSNEVKIIVDEFNISIAPVAVQNLVENEAGTDLTVTENTVADSRQWKYATTAGGPYNNDITGETGTNYTPQFASAGTYYVVCESTLFGNSVTSNEVEINVSVAVNNDVSIAPNSTQNLIENQAGTDLTASETPNSADSREWMYTTTSGSGYTSFSPTETGLSYTPEFATAGTYYVVCVSDFGGGDIVTSDEVEINVVEFINSISPATDQNLDENEAGADITVTENPTADNREWKFSTTSGSGYGSFTPSETGATYTPEFANQGTYYVVCESTIDGITVTSNEVIINVDETVGLTENIKNTFTVYASNQKINVDFTDFGMENADLKVHSTDGKVVSKNRLKDNQMNSIELSVPTGVYFYTISNGKQFFQGKIFIK